VDPFDLLALAGGHPPSPKIWPVSFKIQNARQSNNAIIALFDADEKE